jgi:hypothetical protein
MTNKLFILPLLFFGFSVKAQLSNDFEKELIKLSASGYPAKEVAALYKDYNHILFFFNPNSQLAAAMKGIPTYYFPLKEFRSTAFYQKNIDFLLQDTAWHKRSLGCFLAAAANDTSKVIAIESLLIKSGHKDFWMANILMVLKTRNLEPVVKTMMNYQRDESSVYLLEPFLKLDEGVLGQFATDSVRSKNKYVQYLAIRAMATGVFSLKKDSVLRNLSEHGAADLRGWAIAVLAHFKAPNMLPLVKSYLDIPNLRPIALIAISNSTSLIDKKYVTDFESKDTVDIAVLTAFISSTEETSVKKALYFLKHSNLPEDYVLTIASTTVLHNDKFYDDVSETLSESKNLAKTYPLYEYFSGRKDEKTIRFLLDRLTACKSNDMVSYTIINTLTKIKSDIIEHALPVMMHQASIENVGLIFLLIQYNNHDFDEIIKGWMQSKTLEKFYYDLCKQHVG